LPSIVVPTGTEVVGTVDTQEHSLSDLHDIHTAVDFFGSLALTHVVSS